MALGKMIIMTILTVGVMMAVSGCETPTGPSSNPTEGRRVVKPVPVRHQLGE